MKVAVRVPVLPSVTVTSLMVTDGGGGGGTVQMPSLTRDEGASVGARIVVVRGVDIGCGQVGEAVAVEVREHGRCKCADPGERAEVVDDRRERPVPVAQQHLHGIGS